MNKLPAEGNSKRETWNKKQDTTHNSLLTIHYLLSQLPPAAAYFPPSHPFFPPSIGTNEKLSYTSFSYLSSPFLIIRNIRCPSLPPMGTTI